VPEPTTTLTETALKTCPRCAEEIAAAADVCPYCGGCFRVWIEGYCATCRRVTSGGPDGRCVTCSSELLDVRVESRPVEAPAPAPPAEQRRRWPRWRKVLGAVAVVVACIAVWAVIREERATTPSGGTPATTAATATSAAPRPPAPVPTARLAGAFDVTVRTTWVDGWSSLKAGDRFGFPSWRLLPRCLKGACSAQLSIRWPGTPAGATTQLFPAPVTIALRRSGAVYQGKGKAGLARCVVSFYKVGTLNVWLRVTKGAWVDGSWRATRLKGTVRYSEPATATCTPAGFTATMTARLAGT
jgi:hypothetical protein